MSDRESTRPQPAQQPRRVSRLAALRTAAAGLLGAAGATAFGRTEAAHAADGDTLFVGEKNTASSQTELDYSSLAASAGAALYVNASNAGYAIEGESGAVGVYGNGATGVMGVGDIGGVFSGNLNAVQLNPQGFAGEDFATSPHDGDDHLKGDILVDQNGVLWLCVADGTPGTWIRVSHGGVRLLDSPQRPYSSTNPGPAGGIYYGEDIRTVQVTGVTPGVPDNALGIVGNLTVINSHSYGYFTVYPTGTPKPVTSNINWFQDNMIVANTLVVRLGTGGSLQFYANTLPGAGHPAADVILDVAGYIL